MKARSSSLILSLSNHPLALVVLGSIFGVWGVDRFLTPDLSTFVVILSICSLSVAIALLILDRLNGVALFLFGLGCFALYTTTTVGDYLQRRENLMNRTVYLEGNFEPPNTFHSRIVNNSTVSATFYVSDFNLRNFELDESNSRKLRLTATITWPESSPTFSEYLSRKQFFGNLQITEIHQKKILPKSKYDGFRGWVRDRIENYDSRFPVTANLLKILVLGESVKDHKLQTLFRRLGISHLFVISGFHVGILFFSLQWILDDFSSLTVFYVTSVGVILYLIFLGWPLSATRAGLMYLLWGCARYLRRSTVSSEILISAILILMIANPLVIFQISFHLSVAAILGIFFVLSYREMLPDIYGLELLLVNVGAFLGVLPVLMVHFQYLAPWGWFYSFLSSSIFVVFLVGLLIQLILIVINWLYLAEVLEAVYSSVFAEVNEWVMDSGFLVGIAETPFYVGLLILFCLCVVFERRLDKFYRLVAFCLIIVFLYASMSYTILPHLEVGQISGTPYTYLKTSNGKTLVLIPPETRVNQSFVSGLSNHLQSKNTFHLDYLISDYSRPQFLRFNPGFTASNYLIQWREPPSLTLETGGYDFENNRLDSTFASIVYNTPPFMKDMRYDSRTLVGFTGRNNCLIMNLDRLQSEMFDRIKQSDCEPVFLKSSSKIWGTDTEIESIGYEIPSIIDVLKTWFQSSDII